MIYNYVCLSQQYREVISSNFNNLTAEITKILNTLSADEAKKEASAENNTGYATYNDAVMGASYIYPKEWGKLHVDDFTNKYHLVSFDTDDIYVEVRYENKPGYNYTESIRDDVKDGEKVALSSTNSGIKEIYKEKNGSGNGEWVNILCNNGAVVTILWNVNAYSVEGSIDSSKQSLYDKTQNQVLELVKSLKITENMG